MSRADEVRRAGQVRAFANALGERKVPWPLDEEIGAALRAYAALLDAQEGRTYHCAGCERRERENHRLREALERIAAADVACTLCIAIQRVARQALGREAS